MLRSLHPIEVVGIIAKKNFALSDNKISENSENSNIADDTDSRRERIHLHGTKT